MDIVRTIYKELFTVKILHSGYGAPRPNLIAGSIALEADEETKTLFNNYYLGYRFFGDTLICFMRIAASLPAVPYLKFPGDVRIRFRMNASVDFLSKTVVDAAGAKQVYQFTNQVNIGTGGFISMHTQGVNSDDLKNVNVVNADKICFGVVDVNTSTVVNSSYAIFSGVNQQLISPNYSIRFINKS